MTSRARGDNATTCVRWFFVRSPGMVQLAPSSLNSSRYMPQTSLSLQPVNSKSRNAARNGGASCSVPRQNQRTSTSLNTRSRAGGADGRHTPTQGLLAMRRCRSSQRNRPRARRASCGRVTRRAAVAPGQPRDRRAAAPRPRRCATPCPSISRTSRPAQVSASEPLITSGSVVAGSQSGGQRSPSSLASSRQCRGRSCHLVLWSTEELAQRRGEAVRAALLGGGALAVLTAASSATTSMPMARWRLISASSIRMAATVSGWPITGVPCSSRPE